MGFFGRGTKVKDENTALNHVSNGDRAKDLISGMEGIVISTTKWQHGCDRLEIQTEGINEQGLPFTSQVFDIQRLSLVMQGVVTPGALSLPLDHLPLGSKAKDSITGFEGVIAAQIIGLTGQVDVLLEPDTLDKDGQPRKQAAFEGTRVKLVVEQPVIVDPAAPKKPGGPMRGEELLYNR